MRKIIIAVAVMFSMTTFAQDKVEPVKVKNDYGTLSGYLELSDGIAYGISIESQDKEGQSDIFNVFWGNYVVTGTSTFGFTKDFTGKTFGLGIGKRLYFDNKQDKFYKKWYFENVLTYSKTEFKDADYSGVYEFIAPIDAAIGYKFIIGKGFTIDPSIGGLYKIEIKSRGDVDNNIFPNTSIKVGLKIGWTF